MSELREIEECLRKQGWTDRDIENCGQRERCVEHAKRICAGGGVGTRPMGDGVEATFTPIEIQPEELKLLPLPGDGVVLVAAGYARLGEILLAAFKQASEGKGHDRHARDNAPFDDQPMQRIARDHGIGFITGQARKKMEEAIGMYRRDDPEAAEREFLGAINYLAGAIIFMRDEQ